LQQNNLIKKALLDYSKIFQSFPYSIRVVAANLNGFKLISLRYSRVIDRLVPEAFEHTDWTEQKWRVWQDERLPKTLWRASKNVPNNLHQ
jgi:hypothetical protein